MQYLAMNDVLPWGENPETKKKRGDKVWLRLFEKGAHTVSYEMDEKTYAMQNAGGDILEAPLPYSSGFHYVQIFVEGREVLSPLLPIGYGCSRPYNCVDILSEKEDFLALRDVPHGAVHEELFFSGVTGEWERCLVYSPPVSWTASEPIPVLYLQHGHGENEIGWIAQGKVGILLDNLLAEGKIVPFAVVMNNGMVQKKDPGAAGGHVVDHRLLEPMLLQDVIPFLEAKYHVGGSRTKRGMAGLSMGSMQTSRMVCRHPAWSADIRICSRRSAFSADSCTTGSVQTKTPMPILRHCRVEALSGINSIRSFAQWGNTIPFIKNSSRTIAFLRRAAFRRLERSIRRGSTTGMCGAAVCMILPR